MLDRKAKQELRERQGHREDPGVGCLFPSEKIKLDYCSLKTTYLSLHLVYVQTLEWTYCLNGNDQVHHTLSIKLFQLHEVRLDV